MPENRTPIKVVIVTNIPAPYRIPLFNALSTREDIELVVYFMAKSEKNRKWSVSPGEFDFEYRLLSGNSFYSYTVDQAIGVNPDIFQKLHSDSPDTVVVGGYSDLTSWATIAYAELTDIPIVPWNGSWKGSIKLQMAPVQKLRKLFFQRGNSWIAYGSLAAELMESFGADPERTFEATNTVDVEQLQASLPSERDHTGTFELLYCGQLIERKNVGTVLDALDGFGPDELVFRIVGDGPALDRLNAKADSCSTPVKFEGYVEREELPTYYADADALVLASWREVWGLVVNESLACGTPAIVSTKCGCAPDLIRSGFNGSTFDPDDPDELRDILRSELESSDRQWASADEIRADAVERFSIARATDAFASAIRTAVKS